MNAGRENHKKNAYRQNQTSIIPPHVLFAIDHMLIDPTQTANIANPELAIIFVSHRDSSIFGGLQALFQKPSFDVIGKTIRNISSVLKASCFWILICSDLRHLLQDRLVLPPNYQLTSFPSSPIKPLNAY